MSPFPLQRHGMEHVGETLPDGRAGLPPGVARELGVGSVDVGQIAAPAGMPRAGAPDQPPLLMTVSHHFLTSPFDLPVL